LPFDPSASHSAGVDELLADLSGQHAELDGLLAGREQHEWRRRSPCVGWDVADVVVHLHQTDELALVSLRGGLDAAIESVTGADPSAVDRAADASVAAVRGRPGAEILARWRASAAELRTTFARTDPRARLQWVVGTLSAHTLAATRLAECWIHTTDVAAALGVTVPPTDRLRPIARLAWRTVPYAFAHGGEEPHGAVGFDLVGPSGDAWRFGLDDDPPTVVTGPAIDLCLVAGRRREPAATALRATGPDSEAVLRLVRTYA
jgi:uncharacterized protein (TIGR03084 family)